MATITKRGAKWFAQVRKKGFQARYRSFTTKADAQAWAAATEARMVCDRDPVDTSQLRSLTLGDLLERYRMEVSPCKEGAAVEKYRLGKMLRERVSEVPLAQLGPPVLAAYRDARLKLVSRSTVRNELSLIRCTLELARREWGLPLAANPAALVTLPKPGDARARRLKPGELTRLTAQLERIANGEFKNVVLFAIETAMRRSEILSLSWDRVDLAKRTAHLARTKNGRARTVPLTSRAVAILTMLVEQRNSDRVFAVTASALRYAWHKACRSADIVGLNFHDLRHEAVSRFFELGLSIPEVALISGHRDPRMLFRYTHLRAEDLAIKLN